MKKINLKTIDEILNKYDTEYLLVDGKGCINFDHKYIAINPVFDEDYKTLGFGVVAAYYEDNKKQLSEQEIEHKTHEMLKDNHIKYLLQNHKIGDKYMNCHYDHIPIKQHGYKHGL